MSLKAMAWALEQEIESPAVKLLLIAMCEYVNKETDECWPSTKVLADTVCISERSVRRHLRALERQGFIETRARKTQTGRQTSNVYNVKFEGGQMRHEGGQIDRGDPDTSVPLDPDTSVPLYEEPTIRTKKKEKTPNPHDVGGSFLCFSDLMNLEKKERARYLTENRLTPRDYNSTYREIEINPRSLTGKQKPRKRTTEEIMQAVFAEDARRAAEKE